MAGLGVRVYTDEDVDQNLALQLQRLGYDAVSCRQLGHSNRGLPDEWQLSYAAGDGGAILSHNFRDYYRLDAEWKSAGRAHAGIILTARQGIGEMVRRLRAHLDTVSPEQQRNTLLWL
jgi:hypothetical protein